MENVTKALLIAGGILISIMIVSLIVMMWGRISGYYTERSNSKKVEQMTEFNAQYDNYNGKSVRGNELISIMNKIIDYNNSDSAMEGYDKIIINVEIGEKNKGSFKYNSEDTDIFGISSGKITNKTNDRGVSDIVNLSGSLLKEAQRIDGDITDAQLQKLSADISNIVGSSSDDEYKIQKIKRILGNGDYKDKLGDIQNITKKYYQYTQFKRAMFECTSVEHNTANGRVNEMNFKIEQDENGNVKFK